jgi:hypothetical protein
VAPRNRLLAKALPSTVEDQHVIKATYLGWHDNEELSMMPGYLAAVITYDAYSKDDPGAYSIHLMRTATPDGRWLRIDSRRRLFHDQAESAFAGYDKLAFRPGRGDAE